MAFGAVPATFGSDIYKATAIIMEKTAGATTRRDYLVLDTIRTKTLQKELNEAAAKGYEFAAMSTYGAKSVLMEKRSPDTAAVPDRYLLLATTRTSTAQKEINGAVGKGYAIVAGSVGDEVMIILEKAAKAPEYLLLATARTTTLEKEINEAAARGFRPVPRTLFAITRQRGGLSLTMTPDETCVVMEKSPSQRHSPTRSSALHGWGRSRKNLLKLWEGFELIGFTLSYHEQVGLLRRANSVAAAGQR